MDIAAFQKVVYEYYDKHARVLPWRYDNPDPYHVFISEVMLQQTQVPRVIEKYKAFISAFPSFEALASASSGDVLRQWQGLGYNRRALFLQKAAQVICDKFNGTLPESLEDLESLPGIGPATARSISAFGFDKPYVFFETNVRTVFIHHFFHDRNDVSDDELQPLVEKSLDRKHAGKWYSALMDYGTYLKSINPNPTRKSKHYQKQSKFEGSNRQVRGGILKALSKTASLSPQEISVEIELDLQKIIDNLKILKDEGFIVEKKEKFSLA